MKVMTKLIEKATPVRRLTFSGAAPRSRAMKSGRNGMTMV